MEMKAIDDCTAEGEEECGGKSLVWGNEVR